MSASRSDRSELAVTPVKVAAVVLAAGSSSRLGEPKQTVRFRGEMLLHRAIRIAFEAGVDAIFAVLGAGAEPLSRVLEEVVLQRPELRLQLLVNDMWRSGMASSVALGARTAEQAGAERVLLMTCDQPLVTARHLRTLIGMCGPDETVASLYAGRRGVPAVFSGVALAALQALRGDEGARALLRGAGVRTLDLAGGEVDVDTPGDLERLRQLEAEERAHGSDQRR